MTWPAAALTFLIFSVAYWMFVEYCHLKESSRIMIIKMIERSDFHPSSFVPPADRSPFVFSRLRGSFLPIVF